MHAEAQSHRGVYLLRESSLGRFALKCTPAWSMLREGLLINKHMALRGFRYVTMSMSVVSTACCSGLLLVTREPTRSLVVLIRIMVVYKCTAMLISSSTNITYRRAPSPHPLRDAKLSRRHVVRISTSGNIKIYIKGAGRTAVLCKKVCFPISQ